MCATTRWATWSRAIGGCAASTSSIRWDGTRSACRPKTPRCRTTTHPAEWTYANIADMRAQLQSMGLSLDWSREIATCDPSYYKQEQRLFLRLARARPRHAQEVEGQLGSGRSDRARQRAGDRRPRLALGRAGRAARDTQCSSRSPTIRDDLLAEPRQARPLAGTGAPDAGNWIGRSEGLLIRFVVDPRRSARSRRPDERARGLHHARRHVLRRDLHGDRARHPLAGAAREARPGARGVHRRMPHGRHVGRGDRDRGEEGLRHRPQGSSSVRPDLARCRSMSPTSC